MTQNRTAQILIFTACALLVGGCGKKASEEIDLGTIKNSVYQNQFFGFQLTIPPDWSVQDKEMREQLAAAGKELVAGEDKNLKAAIKASEQQTVNLLAAYKHPIGSPVPYNPGLACIAERVRHLPGVKRGKDYHFHARKFLESSQMKVSFPKEIATEKLGGIDFDVMYVSLTVGATVVQQKYYAAIMKEYALIFVASFTTADEQSMLEQVLQTVSFK